ncbi:MAG: hypothetical protein WC789_09490 [Lentisphaeria bacterium]
MTLLVGLDLGLRGACCLGEPGGRPSVTGWDEADAWAVWLVACRRATGG